MRIAPYRVNSFYGVVNGQLFYFVTTMKSIFLFAFALACYQCETVDAGKKQIASVNLGY